MLLIYSAFCNALFTILCFYYVTESLLLYERGSEKSEKLLKYLYL